MTFDTQLYNGEVLVRFNGGSHRYTVSTDKGQTWSHKLGVTTILRTLSKPGLELWPMDEALKYLFGQTFEEVTQDDGSIIVEPRYNVKTAQMKPGYGYITLELQQALERARAAHTIKRDKGGDVGTEVHEAIYLTLHGKIVDVTELSKEAQKAFKAWFDWFTYLSPGVLAYEQVVYSKGLDYCGTLDAVLEIDGKRVLVDWKTQNYSRTAPLGIYPENFIQLGGYAKAYMEEHGEVIDDLLIVNASKQGKVNAVYASELDVMVPEAESLFIQTLTVFNKRAELASQLKQVKEKTHG